MLLEMKNVSFRYDKKSPMILEGLSLSIRRGESIALISPSGFGKTTLARLLSGYLSPTRGSVTLDGAPVSSFSPCPVQLIHQNILSSVDPRFRMRDVLLEAGMIDDSELSRFMIEREWLSRFSRELSLGELSRFSILRALMARPAFIICDEITSMLDAITQAQIWHELLSVSRERNIALITVTHDRALAARVSDTVFDLTKSSLIRR